MSVTILDNVDELSADWLIDALGPGGDGIASVSAEPLGTGQMCDSYRISATRSGGPPGTWILKLPSSDPSSSAAGLMLRAYEKEVRFYQELACDLDVRTPSMHAADIDTTTGAFVLLLEDLAPAAPGDQLAGCSPAQAEAAISELVKLHAPRWGDPRLRDLEWLLGDRGVGREMVIGLLPTLWTGFVERYGDRLTEEVRSAGGVLFDRLSSFYEDREPSMIVHGDYRLDNLLFHPDDGSVAVLDWQTCTVGPGPADAAYFIGAGLLPDERRIHERHLFEHYHRGLVAEGVEVSEADCWEAYRRGTWAGLVMAVGASMLVQRTARGDDMFMVMASRHALHALDLDAGELLVD